jgi:hypothetical protein
MFHQAVSPNCSNCSSCALISSNLAKKQKTALCTLYSTLYRRRSQTIFAMCCT